MEFGFPGGSDSKESTCNVGDPSSIHGPGKSPWRREWQPTPVFLPEEFNGQKILVGYSPWGYKESDTTEQLILSHFLEVRKSASLLAGLNFLGRLWRRIHFLSFSSLKGLTHSLASDPLLHLQSQQRSPANLSN